MTWMLTRPFGRSSKSSSMNVARDIAIVDKMSTSCVLGG